MTNNEKMYLSNRRKALKTCFEQLKKELKKFPEDSNEYMEIFSELSSISIELDYIRRMVRCDRLSGFKDLLEKIVFDEKIDSYKGKTR